MDMRSGLEQKFGQVYPLPNYTTDSGVWVAYVPGSTSPVVPFRSEIDALRYAVARDGYRVKQLRYGQEITL